ncbi:MAG: hypothetical protein ACLQU2_01800 [Candidatus Binataceae bacterium]
MLSAFSLPSVLNLTLAAIIHVAFEMTFIVNSARLLPRSDRMVTHSQMVSEEYLEMTRKAA